MPSVRDLFDLLWNDYTRLNPIAGEVHSFLEQRGEKILNDHIALRTFQHPQVGIEVLARPFIAGGYEPCGEYHFKEKKLFARHYEHSDPEMPKVFISELKLGECSPKLQKTVSNLLSQMPADLPSKPEFLVCGRPWSLEYSVYEDLASESEYAAWMAAFGFRANHFTVNVNALRSFPDLESLNEFLKQKGVRLNQSGGEIKGSPEVLLEQSSTLANRVKVSFSEGEHFIPACYYEFARRYPDETGKLYQGFVEKSADKIFESTDRKQ